MILLLHGRGDVLMRGEEVESGDRELRPLVIRLILPFEGVE